LKILSLSGFVPEQITDTVRFTQYSGNRRIPHFCGYAADYISQVLDDRSIDGAVFPRSCDSCRTLPDYLSDSGKFTYQLNIPPRRDDAAVLFLASRIKDYKEAVERHYGVEISDIAERTNTINKRNSKIADIYNNIADISYSGYLRMIQDMLKKPLSEEVSAVPENAGNTGKAVYIIGSFMSNINVIDTIENAGLNILGDNLTESKRLFSAPNVDTKDDVFFNIARSILHNKPSPSQSDFTAILKADLDEIKHKGIDGVLFITQKYCEPYDYLFSCYKKMLDENSIPVLRLVLSDTTDNTRFNMAIESFADIL
jgi:benzoyl-CoA reductase/2-hydroxyglutaryl-CoA dehydratase subunit BcrC/BadD/HgdB